MVVEDLDLDAEEKFTLVGIRDVDYGAGKIRVDSPLARGLLRKKAGRQGCDQGPRRDTQP